MDQNPPFLKTYKSFFDVDDRRAPASDARSETVIAEECNLPIVDLQSGRCKEDIANASSEWGFFQVVNHGIPQELLERMRSVLLNVFRQPFERKAREKLLDFSAESYRWGTPSATSLQQLSWSEAYHIPLASAQEHDKQSARLTIEELMKGGRWITVKPNPSALVINIGDLCEAWSNGVYRSVEHRVMSNPKVERFSVAYFLCPSYDTMIRSHTEPAIYRKFTFKEYRQQVQEDVKLTGHKVGLSRFLA